jgi:hypothetical protein
MLQGELTKTEAKKLAEKTEFDHLANSKALWKCRQYGIYSVSCRSKQRDGMGPVQWEQEKPVLNIESLK